MSKRRFLKGQFAPHRLQGLPWLKSVDTFYADCTACGECVTSCPEGIVRQSDGLPPQIDFQRGECTFCYKCAQSCPENLFLSMEEEPWQQAIEISGNCLAKAQVECRICIEECEAQALTAQLSIGSVAQPVFDSDRCTGCGACIKPCPTDAITMIDRLIEEA